MPACLKRSRQRRRAAAVAGLALALAALLSAAAGASDPAAGVAARAGWARAGIVRAPGGPELTDALGRSLQLHGVNLVDKCGGAALDADAEGSPCVGSDVGPGIAYVLSPTAPDPARRFTIADALTLAGLGVNVVRLGIIWEGLEPGPAGVAPNDPVYCSPHAAGRSFPGLGSRDPYDPGTVSAYLQRTDQIVEILADAGIRVIIDMHQDAWGSAFFNATGATPWNGEGAPPWATCTWPAPTAAMPPGWGSAYDVAGVQDAFHHFWANDVSGDLQGQFARVWEAVARHYRGNPDVIGYEVANEPNDYRTDHVDAELECDYGGPVHEPRSCALSHAQALPDGLIGAIRSADPGHVVIFEPSGSTDFGDPERIGIAEPLRFADLALAFHVYGATGAQIAQTRAERDATITDQPGGPAWMMDEFGASADAPAAAATVAAADAAGLSWAFWEAFQLDDPTAGTPDDGVLDELTRAPYPALARALAVPYAFATAGAPGAQSYRPSSRRLRYVYVPSRRIRAPTEIELPTYTYPDGYRVRVVGARVTSARDAPLLELVAGRRAAQVTVSVSPRR
ncbi:MAG: cellulase family glycosylhydrolase [Solirubrobacteraceae bacterium]